MRITCIAYKLYLNKNYVKSKTRKGNAKISNPWQQN